MLASALRRRAHLALPPRRSFFAWSGQVTDLKDKLQDIERSQSERAQSMMELLEAQKHEAAREAQQQPLALLIDADNTSWRSIGPIMDEVATFGVASARRIYGDWTSQRLAPWKGPLSEFAITPIQQFANTVGKNNTDSAMIIDAMDLLHSRRYEVFCIVSSDADFTRLATRIREDGRTVVGIGREMTPRAFVAACDKFITIETLQSVRPNVAGVANGGAASAAAGVANGVATAGGAIATGAEGKLTPKQQASLKMLRDVIGEMAGDDGWTSLSMVGGVMRTRDPAFDPRSFGASGIGRLVSGPLCRYELMMRGSDLSVRPRPDDRDRAKAEARERDGAAASTDAAAAAASAGERQ